MRKKLCGLLSLISVLCLAVVCPFLNILKVAASEFQIRLDLSCVIDDTPLSDMNWNIYRVADINEKNQFVLSGDFADYAIDMEDLKDTTLQDAANTLENYAIVDKIAPLASAVSDEKGNLSFEINEVGLYMLTSKPVYNGRTKFTGMAALVSVTESMNDQTFILKPKFSKSIVGDGEKNYTVIKKWLGDTTNYRPHNVAVDLFKDGEFYNTVILSEENNWQYSWTSSAEVEWRVKEPTVDERYVVVYRYDDIYIYVENTWRKNNNVENESNGGGNLGSGDHWESSRSDSRGDLDQDSRAEENSDGSHQNNSYPGYTNIGNNNNGNSKLPQTGQLWWPVPLLALSGLIFIAVGIRLNSKKEHDNEE